MTTTVTDETFTREVLNSSVPVFVHFHAPWCGICRLITPILKSIQPEWPGPLLVTDINADENLKLANQYQLKTLPTLLYIEKGKVLHRIEGFKSRSELRARLDDIARRCRLDATLSRSA